MTIKVFSTAKIALIKESELAPDTLEHFQRLAEKEGVELHWVPFGVDFLKENWYKSTIAKVKNDIRNMARAADKVDADTIIIINNQGDL